MNKTPLQFLKHHYGNIDSNIFFENKESKIN